MWPWEHLSIGYLLYSAAIRAILRRPPDDDDTLLLLVGTQFPDLIDKPGSWVFGVFPSGTSVAHSILIALPMAFVVVELARRNGAPELGIAFAIGYLSHLFGDVVYPILLGGGPAVNAILWPFVPHSPPSETEVVPLVSGFFSQYVNYLASPQGLGYVLLEFTVISLALAVWVRDRTPGSGTFRRVRAAVRDGSGRR